MMPPATHLRLGHCRRFVGHGYKGGRKTERLAKTETERDRHREIGEDRKKWKQKLRQR